MTKIIEILLFIIGSLLIAFPIYQFGFTDIEEYNLGLFTTNYFYQKFNPFTTFIDFVGAGISLPLGQGLFFFPTNLFNFNFELFYILTIILSLNLQFNYFNKITKKLFKFKSSILSFLFLLSLANFNYLFFTDWISCFVTYTLIMPIMYYSIKLGQKRNFYDFPKLILFFSMLILNGHLGFAIFIVYFILIFNLINLNFFYLKKYYFYIFLLLFFLIISERLYNIILLYLNSSDIPFGIHNGYGIKDYLFGIIKPFFTFIRLIEIFFNFNDNFDIKPINGREVVYGFTFIISLIFSIFIIIKKKSKNIFYINIIFLIFFSFTFFKHSWIPFSSGAWQSRDILNVLSFLIFSFFVYKIKKNKKTFQILIILVIFTNLFLWLESFNFINKNNFISLKHFNKTNENIFLAKITSPIRYKKLYLSPEVYNLIENSKFNSNYFTKNYIFSSIDLYKYKINPFNLKIKNQEVPSLRKSNIKMYSNIEPRYNEINNQKFLNLFKIEDILIFEDELKFINMDLFSIKDQLEIDDKLIILLELKKIKHVVYKNNDKISFKDCPEKENINCILSKNFILEKENFTFKKNTNGNFTITNNNDYSINYILPFTDIKKFVTHQNLNYIKNSLVAVKIEPFKTVNIKIENKFNKYLRLISFLTFFISLIYILFNKLLNIKKSHSLKLT